MVHAEKLFLTPFLAASIALASLGCGTESDTPPPVHTAPPIPVPPPSLPVLAPPPPPPPTPTLPAGPGPQWVDLVLPQVPGWELEAPQDHGPERGYVASYQHGSGVRVTVFVYNGGRTGIRRDAAILQEELRVATQGVHQAQQSGAYDAVRELESGMTRLGTAPSAPIAATQSLLITAQGAERPSSIWVSSHRAFFFKIRSTLQAGPSPAADLALAELLAQLGAVLREDGAAGPPPPPGGGVQVLAGQGQAVWPPSGPGCDALVRCCDAASQSQSSVGLFCQLGAATGGACSEQLARVRSYVAELGGAVPAACQ